MATITTTATTICTTCSAPFPSKTKLFQHIKMKNIDGTLSKCNIEAQKNGVILKDHIYSKSSEKVIIFFETYYKIKQIRTCKKNWNFNIA